MTGVIVAGLVISLLVALVFCWRVETPDEYDAPVDVPLHSDFDR